MNKRVVKRNLIISLAVSLMYIALGAYVLLAASANGAMLDELDDKTDNMGNGTVELYGKLFGMLIVSSGRLLNSVVAFVFGRLALTAGTIMLVLALIALALNRLKAPYRLLMTMAYIIMLMSSGAYATFGGVLLIPFMACTAAAVYGLYLTYSKQKATNEMTNTYDDSLLS